MLFIILISVSGCNTDNFNDPEKRTDRWAWWIDASSQTGKWIPLSKNPTWKNGTFTKFYYDGKIASKGTIKNGKYADTTFWFDRTGNIYAYKINDRDSAMDYYILDGPIKVFNPDGKLKMEGIIKNHKPGDKWTEYHQNGFPERIIDETNDTGWITHYYPDGKIKDSLFAWGEYSRILGEWNENGERTSKTTVKGVDYDGMYYKYYDDGKLKQKASYSDGKVNGKGFYYYPSGNVEKEYNFKDNLKDGKNYEYYENGQIQNDMFYKNGLLEGEQKAYDEKGNLIASPYFRDGLQIR